jgi:hypothetical protein
VFEHIHKTHPTSLQIQFVELLVKLFPNTKILSVCESSAINEHVPTAEKLFATPWYSHKDKPNDRTTDWLPLPESMPSRKNQA